MGKAISGLLIVAALLHLVPALGVFGNSALSMLYGAAFQQINQQIVMRHQAVLNGLLGALLLYAAWRPRMQPLALIAGNISLLSFLVFALLLRNYNPPVDKLVLGDLAALACLLTAAGLFLFQQRRA
jgi:RsiW-degrading membrane proteinase PrsW (M82 family)